MACRYFIVSERTELECPRDLKIELRRQALNYNRIVAGRNSRGILEKDNILQALLKATHLLPAKLKHFVHP